MGATALPGRLPAEFAEVCGERAWRLGCNCARRTPPCMSKSHVKVKASPPCLHIHHQVGILVNNAGLALDVNTVDTQDTQASR